jgi:calpain-15
LLADAMIELCISKGSITSKGLANAALYTLANGYSGLIVVAENYNENFFLHIELNCDNSSNVVSTRRTLITKDSVPPLHRQVLLVLTQLETSSSYSINYSMKYRLSSNPYLNTWPGSGGLKEMNMPALKSEVFGLHAPRSIFN